MAKTAEIKISLNHKIVRELLEDPQFVIEVKSAILTSALQGTAAKVVSQDFTRLVQKECQDITAQEIGVAGSWDNKVKWSSKFETQVKNKVKGELDTRINSIVKDTIENSIKTLESTLEEYVENVVHAKVERIAEKFLKTRMEEVMKSLFFGGGNEK